MGEKTGKQPRAVHELHRWDVVFIQDTGYTGSEQNGNRYAVVVSNELFNHFSTCVNVAYITKKNKRNLPTHAEVMCKHPSIACCEQVFTVDKSRVTQVVRTCTEEEMQGINKCIGIQFGLVPGYDKVIERGVCVNG